MNGRAARHEVHVERTKVASELSETKAQLAGIIDSAMDAIITVDRDQRVLIFNESAAEMFGCTAKETIGQSLDRFLPARFRRHHSGYIREFSKSGLLPTISSC